MFWELIVMSLAVAAMSYTVARSKLFFKPRKWVTKRSQWFGQLVNCPYCLSHWFALGFVVETQWRPLGVWCGLDYLVGMLAIVCVSAFAIGGINRAFSPKKHVPDPMPIPPSVVNFRNE